MCGVDLKEGGDEGSGEINGYNRKATTRYASRVECKILIT